MGNWILKNSFMGSVRLMSQSGSGYKGHRSEGFRIVSTTWCSLAYNDIAQYKELKESKS